MPVSTPPNTILYSTVNVIGKIFTSRALFVRAVEAAFLKTLKDPEFVAEAEKTRMTLNPIPGATLHNMIVEGLSMPAALKESSSRSLRRRVSGRAGRHFGIRSILGSSAVSSFLDREIPREPEVIELFKKLVGAGPLPTH